MLISLFCSLCSGWLDLSSIENGRTGKRADVAAAAAQAVPKEKRAENLKNKKSQEQILAPGFFYEKYDVWRNGDFLPGDAESGKIKIL